MSEMAGIGVFEMSFLFLAVLGGGGVLLLLLAIAVAKSRLSAAAILGGGLALLALLVAGGIVATFFAVGARPTPQLVNTYPHHTLAIEDFRSDFEVPVEHHLSGGDVVTRTTVWRWGLIALPAVACVVAFIVAVIVRRWTGENRSWWPALLLVPLAALFFMGTVRYQTRSSYRHAPNSFDVSFQLRKNHAHQQTGDVVPAPPVPPRPAEPAELVAAAEMQRVFQEGDIHELMDKADAPRIPLVAENGPQTDADADAEAKAEPEDVTPKDNAEAEAKQAAAAADAAEVDEVSPAEADTAAADAEANDEAAEAKSSSKEEPAIAESSEKQQEDANAEQPIAVKEEGAASEDSGTTEQPAEKQVEAHVETVAGAKDAAAEREAARKDQAAAPAEAQLEPERPEWVKQPVTSLRRAKQEGEWWLEVIATDEYATEAECRRAMDILLMLKTYERLTTLTGTAYANSSLPSLTFHNGMVVADGEVILHSNSSHWSDWRLMALNRYGIGLDYIHREIVADQYLEEAERSFGPMYKLHTQLKFTPAVDAELRRRHANSQRVEHLAVVGVGAFSVLGFLGVVYGLLKVDTLTKGYYTKWLFVGLPAAIIGGFLLLFTFDSFFLRLIF